MSLPKAQLVDPQGNMNLPGMTATGIVTASSLKGVTTGSATGLTGNPDLDVGIVTASSFVGQGDGHAANLTGTPQLNLGVTTSTGFIGDAVGKAAGLTGTPNLNVGLITATSFVGFVTGDVTGNITGDVTGNITGNIQGDVEGNVTGNVSGFAGGLGINGLNVWTGAGTSNLGVGVCTAIELYGDGSGLVGAGSSAYIAQNITATGAETIIDLSYGNLIYYKGNANTTVGFASTSPAEQLTFIRDTGDPNFTTGGVDFDGTGDYLSLPDSTDWDLGQNFTVEAWIYPRSFVDNHNIICTQYATGTTNEWYFSVIGTALKFRWWPSGEADGTIGDIELNKWTHVAASCSSGVVQLYVNGTATGSSAGSVNIGTAAAPFYIGKQGSIDPWDGIISNLRIVKGTGVYTSDFTPPLFDLENITNTKLLCCQSDSSTTASAVTPGTITANGDPTAGAQTISVSLSTTITWPDRVKWNGGSTPTLINNDVSAAFQIFRFTTVDTGLNYNAWQEMIYDAPPQGGLFTWGNASDGLLGLNNTTYRSSPTQVGSNTNWSGLSRSINFSAPLFGVKADGTLWGWGSATNGELGQNYVSPLRLSSPVQISGTTWKNVDFGYQAAAAVKTDGTLWAWGKNDGGNSGVLGQNNLTNYSSPVQVGTETTWGTTMTTFGVSFRTMSNIKTDGSLWSWGYSDYGGSGHNNRTKYSSPRQVGTDTTWSSISQGYGAATAIKTDGTLWGWGRARYGELPFNDGGNPGNRSSPTQIGTDTNWSFVSQGNAFGSAIKTDGTLWMWGAGNEGRLGQNNETQRSSPIQIPGTTWSNVCATAQNMQALKTDGTFWVWGHAGSGRLGLNAPGAAHISSPTQIPGTWQIIGSSGNTGSAIK